MTATTTRYSAQPKQAWTKKASHANTPGPSGVSIYGALPHPREAYEMTTDGWTIYDAKTNTYSNYFFGKVGIETEQEANETIARLDAR